MRNSLLILMLWLPLSTNAAWTGIAGFIGSSESEWLVANSSRIADINFYGLRIEEKTNADIRIGLSAGQFNLRLREPGNTVNAEKFSGEKVSLYLRWPLALTRHVKLHSDLHYGYHRGRNQVKQEPDPLTWYEWEVNLGLSSQLGRVSIRPLLNLRWLDGDISDASSLRLFELKSARSIGVIADYYVEPTAYIRFRVIGNDNRSLKLEFVREL